MAQSLYDVDTIFKKCYSLQVAVRCTSDADTLCRKNNLTFCELMEPFSHLSSPVQSKDLQGHPYTLKNVHVRFSDPQLEPTPTTELQNLLSEVVKNGVLEGKQPLIHYGNVTTNATTPWYDGYRDIFLGRLRAEDREPICHYVSVLLVVSSTEPSVMEAFAGLYTKQKESEQAKSSNWLTPHMFYYHILLHDILDGGNTRAEDNLAKAQATYGTGSCCLLRINSRQPGTVVLGENPWSRVARRYTTVSTDGEDEPDGISKFKFSIGKHRNKKSPKIAKGSPPTNHPAPPPVTVSPISPPPTATPPLLPTTSISPPPSISSSTSLPPLPTDTHPLLEDAPSNHEIIAPNVREEATLEQSSSDESLSETNQHSSSPVVLPGERELKMAEGKGGSVVGRYLSADDENVVRHFVSEFLGQRLVPHLEAVLKNLNEWLISRRSVRRSITSMSKRFFGMLGGQLNNTAADEPSYVSSSQEFQTRQFADLSFLLQSYEQAFLNYSAVKKDFHSSSAWMHYAKTVEMCAVTAYMMSSTRRDIAPFFEEAISLFNLSCKSPVNALRCAVLLCEVLKERGMYRDLTQVCIKMTTEESDLHSAVCLEQAAHAFLRIHPTMAHKYALHLILAGHRYAKSGQRVHSARVYTQALELYRNKGWALAEDYVHFSLARHCFCLQRLRDARLAFEHLLSHESVQLPHQQLLNLREYVYVHKLLLNDTDYCSGQQVKLGLGLTSLTSAVRVQSVPLLPIPFVKSSLTRVILQTGVRLERLQELLTCTSSNNDSSTESGVGEERELRGEAVRPLSIARIRMLLQQLTVADGSSSETKPLIIGARDFNPNQMKGSTEEWRELEEVAARGPRGTHRENFRPWVVMMNESTHNSVVPNCVVNESVSVGIVLRNPLKAPLVMRNIALTWSHSPLPSSAGDSQGGGEKARAEVVERIVLHPLSEKMMSLKITPLCEGELDVLGFIYHLCVEQGAQVKRGSESPSQLSASKSSLPSLAVSSKDSLYQRQQNLRVQHSLAEGVQGRVEFSVQGPRLNLTKEHKTGVVYGSDHRLHWRITTPMPRALVRVSGVPDGVLCGEVCRVTVEVVNCGQVPLNSLRITSSATRRLLLDSSEGTLRSSGSVYPSSVPSTTPSPSFLSPRLQTPPCIELPLPSGRLEPGGGVSVDMVLQTVDPLEKGEVPWNLLLYYEPTLITSHSTMIHRVLQYSHILSVRESLVLRSTATPTQSPTTTHTDRFDLNQLVVMLEAENKCQDAVEMRILQVSCISHNWSIQRMDEMQGVVSLFPKEAAMIPLKVSRHSLSPSTDSGSRNLCFSDVPLGPTSIPSRMFPVVDLLSATAEYQRLVGGEEQEEERVGWGGRENTGERRSEPSDIILVVFWQALVSQGTDVVYSYGHHLTPVRLPQSMTFLSESVPSSVTTYSPYDLVKHYLDHPASLTHNFSTVAYCQVPVVITLQNCCHCTVQVILELSHPKQIPQDTKSNSKHSVSDSGIVWTGATCMRHISLTANSLQTVRVFANFTKAGVYNLQNVKVWATQSTDYHIQRWQRTSLISVVDSSQ